MSFHPELKPKERLMLLQDNAAKVEDTTYQRDLTENELADTREALADDYIKLDQFDDELAKVKNEYKVKMDPLRDANRLRLTEIKTKQRTVKGLLYHIADYENSMMITYDGEGTEITRRRLKPDEKQGTIFSLSKTGND